MNMVQKVRELFRKWDVKICSLDLLCSVGVVRRLFYREPTDAKRRLRQ